MGAFRSRFDEAIEREGADVAAKHARGDYDPTEEEDEGLPVAFFGVACALLAVAAAVSVAVLVGLVSGPASTPSGDRAVALVSVSDRAAATDSVVDSEE